MGGRGGDGAGAGGGDGGFFSATNPTSRTHPPFCGLAYFVTNLHGACLKILASFRSPFKTIQKAEKWFGLVLWGLEPLVLVDHRTTKQRKPEQGEWLVFWIS